MLFICSHPVRGSCWPAASWRPATRSLRSPSRSGSPSPGCRPCPKAINSPSGFGELLSVDVCAHPLMALVATRIPVTVRCTHSHMALCRIRLYGRSILRSLVLSPSHYFINRRLHYMHDLLTCVYTSTCPLARKFIARGKWNEEPIDDLELPVKSRLVLNAEVSHQCCPYS